jgi:S1-C subfamily serine protease
VVLAVNSKPVATREDLRLLVSEYSPGSRLDFNILRKGSPLSVSIVLGKTDENPNELVTGVTVAPLTDEERGELEIDGRVTGLLVTAVADDSPFSDRLSKNMVIVSINRTAVPDLTTARSVMQPGRNLFLVYYQGALSYFSISVK